MEIYSNEKEQIDALRRFFLNYGKILLTTAILAAGVLAGWYYWQQDQSNSEQERSAAYQQVISALNDDQPDTLDAVARYAFDNHNTYGVMASLNLAKHYADLGKLGKAAAQLQMGLKNTRDDLLRSLIRLRLARIQLEQKKTDDALKTLDEIKDESWSPMVAEVRGEALKSKGDTKGARAAWQQAIDANNSSALRKRLLMRINDLPR